MPPDAMHMINLTDLINLGHLTDTALRAAALLAGVAIFLHFACMAARVDGKDACLLDALLVPACAASGVGLAYSAAVLPAAQLVPALLMVCLALLAFVLRIWHMGFHFSRFLHGRHPPGGQP